MSIGPTPPVGGPGGIEPGDAVRSAESKVNPPPIQDRVDVSEAGRLTSEALQVDPTRAEKVAELRRAVEAGSLETPERLGAALERFLAQNQDLLV